MLHLPIRFWTAKGVTYQMRIQRWGTALLVAGTVTLSGAVAFAAAPSGTSARAGRGAAGDPAACAALRAGVHGHADVWSGRPGAWGRQRSQMGSGTARRARMASGRRRLVRGCFVGMRPMMGGAMQAAANYLGLSVAQIRSDLRAGESLNDIANSVSGKSPAGLQTALLSAVQANLARLVSAGKLSGARQQKILAAVQSRLPRMMARTWQAPQGSSSQHATASGSSNASDSGNASGSSA